MAFLEYKEDVVKLGKKAKDRLRRLEVACQEAGEGLEGKKFPIVEMVYMYVVAIDGMMEGGGWGLKKETRAGLMILCASGLARMGKDGYLATGVKLDRVPGTATGVGKPVLEAAIEVLALKCTSKRPDVQCKVIGCIEVLLTSQGVVGVGSSTLLQTAAQMMFRFKVCSRNVEVQRTAKSSLEASLLHAIHGVEDASERQKHIVSTITAAVLIIPTIFCVFLQKKQTQATSRPRPPHRHTFSSSFASSDDLRERTTTSNNPPPPVTYQRPDNEKPQLLTEDAILTKLLPAELDVYRLTRALSNLSSEDISKEEDPDSVNVKSRVFAGSMLLHLVSHVGGNLANSTLMVAAVKHHLLRAFAENMGKTRPGELFENAVSGLQVIVHKIPRYMRAEISGLLVVYLLPLVRCVGASFVQKIRVVDVLESILGNPVRLISMFVNHDASLTGDDTIREIMKTVSFLATHDYTCEGWVSLHQSQILQHRAADVICNFTTSLTRWVKTTEPAQWQPPALVHIQSLTNKEIIRKVTTAYKRSWSKGLQVMLEYRVLPDDSPASVAKYLFENAENIRLDPAQTGELLLKNKPWNYKVLNEYMGLQPMSTVPIDESLRNVLSQFLPLGESQVIDRLLYVFVSHFAVANYHSTMLAPRGEFSQGDDVLLSQTGADQHPVRAVVLKSVSSEEPEIEVTTAPFDLSEKVTLTVKRQTVRKLNFIYFAAYTLLIINTQYNKNIKAEDMRKQSEIVPLLVTQSNGELSQAACEDIVKGVYEKEMKLSTSYSSFNQFELTAEACEAWEAYRSKLPNTNSSVATNHNHNKQVWLSKEAVLEVSPEPFLQSELPVKKAAAKTFELGADKLRERLHAVVQRGGHLESAYYQQMPSKRESASLLFQHLWPYCKVVFDTVLRSNSNIHLMRKVRDAMLQSSELACHLGLNLDETAEKVAGIRETHERLAEYHQLRRVGAAEGHPVGVLAELMGF